MKSYKDLSEADKQKFTAYLTLKGLMKGDYNFNIILAFISLLFGIFLSISVSLIGINFFNMGINLDSASLINNGWELMMTSTFIGFAFAIIFFIILFLAYYRKQQDDKLLYVMFDINDVTKDMMEIEKEDLKKIIYGFRKVK